MQAFVFITYLKVTLETVSYHSNRKVTKTEVGTKKRAMALAGLTMRAFGGIWKTLGLKVCATTASKADQCDCFIL